MKGGFKLSKKIVIFSMLVILVFGAACSGSPEESSSSTSSSSTVQSQATQAVLSFTVNADTWNDATDESLKVKIEGTDEDGKNVSELYVAVPSTKYNTDLKPGTYTISLASASPSKGTNLFKATQKKFDFTADSNQTVVLDVVLDKDAIAAAEKKAAEEKAAAEKKAAEEKAAADKKAAEEKAVREAAAAAQSAPKASDTNSATNSASERTVYIASSGNGKKYHSNPNCSRMKGTISLTISQAQGRGYGPCSKCM